MSKNMTLYVVMWIWNETDVAYFRVDFLQDNFFGWDWGKNESPFIQVPVVQHNPYIHDTQI
jgi:hypothetical protein